MKKFTIALSFALAVATEARADQATIANLDSAIAFCTQTLVHARSGLYRSYRPSTIDPLLNAIADRVTKARATSSSHAAIAVIDPVLLRISKILNNDSAHPGNNYSIPTVKNLFKSLESSLVKAKADEKAALP